MTAQDVPDPWFVTLGGRTRGEHDLDMASLIVTERTEVAGLGLEEARVIGMCTTPLSVMEIASYLGLPLGFVSVLLSTLIDQGRITVRRSQFPTAPTTKGSSQSRPMPEQQLLERVLVGLRKL
ncbi:DUF742 domain-containing protein [Streptomyces sp. NPDC057654]|uniref:DUF742 domain-containing protein n=1 Tax=Streptomyces sp. NPDC057654 TaxID=3346196 RepID=UPI0036B7880A